MVIMATLAAAATAVLVALPSILNGFVYDDVWIVQDREVVHSLHPLGELLAAPFWPEARGGYMWRPTTLFAFAGQWVVGGGSPAVFHAVSVVLYGMVSGLVALLGAWLFAPMVGMLAGILFAVHPVHVEVTANVVGQAELLAALGYLVALAAAWERSGSSDKGTRSVLLVAVVAGVAFGLGAKEHVVTIPAALLAVWWRRGTRDGEGFAPVARREWPALIASIVVIVGYLALRARFAHSAMAAGDLGPGMSHTSMLDRAVIMLPVSLEWLRLLFLPFQLSADYSPQHLVPDRSFGLMHAAAAMTWIAVVVGTWRRRDRWPAAFVGVVMFAATISVVSNVIVPLEVLLAERLLFLPSVGWALAIGGFLGAARFRNASVRRHVTTVAAATVVLAFAVRSVGRAGVWRTNEVFFRQLLHDAPDSFRAHWVSGALAFERGDSAIGEREMLTAVRLYPDNVDLLHDLGILYASTDRYQPAIPLLERAVAIDSTAVSTALALALALGRTERYPDALVVLDAMTRLHGETNATLVVRGDVLSQSGDEAGALAEFEELTRQAPESWRYRILAAQAAARVGRCDVARAQVDTARQLALATEQSLPTLDDPGLCR